MARDRPGNTAREAAVYSEAAGMTATAEEISRRDRRAMVTAWLVAGTLDIIAAVIHYVAATGRNPEGVFLYIASGIFGRAAYSGGTLMSILGGVIHYCIAFAWTAVFFKVYPVLPILRRSRIVTGAGYGVFVWLVMNLVVLPLSRVSQPPFDPLRALTGILILILCVGLPVSLVIGKHYTKYTMHGS